jgi:hypothetical protein
MLEDNIEAIHQWQVVFGNWYGEIRISGNTLLLIIYLA